MAILTPKSYSQQSGDTLREGQRLLVRSQWPAIFFLQLGSKVFTNLCRSVKGINRAVITTHLFFSTLGMLKLLKHSLPQICIDSIGVPDTLQSRSLCFLVIVAAGWLLLIA
jgi:hypothetical protein